MDCIHKVPLFLNFEYREYFLLKDHYTSEILIYKINYYLKKTCAFAKNKLIKFDYLKLILHAFEQIFNEKY